MLPQVNLLAESWGLMHESQGVGARRKLIVWKPSRCRQSLKPAMLLEASSDSDSDSASDDLEAGSSAAAEPATEPATAASPMPGSPAS